LAGLRVGDLHLPRSVLWDPAVLARFQLQADVIVFASFMPNIAIFFAKKSDKVQT